MLIHTFNIKKENMAPTVKENVYFTNPVLVHISIYTHKGGKERRNESHNTKIMGDIFLKKIKTMYIFDYKTGVL